MTINRQWKMGLGAVIGLMALPAWVAAQLAITLTLPSAKALLYEDVIAKVVIQNNSGQMLTMDSIRGPVRFWLDVEHDGGRIIPRRDDAPLVSDVKIMPGEVRTFGFNVPHLYAIRSQGLYKIRADVELNGAHYVSQETTLEVVSGFEFQRLTVGVPGDAHAMRTYILSYFPKDGIENIYLRIEDADKNVYGLFNLGRVIRVRPVEFKVDEVGNVHVLFQTMGMGFVHTAFTPFGVQLFARTYTGARGRASLAQQPNGQITVPEGTETVVSAPVPPPVTPVATTVEDKVVVDKTKKKMGTGGMVGQFMQPSSDEKP
ncbi:MAG: hypothetical protein NT011_10715 [Kiritimatiellaeota bacterium]|nr:hypothetical protein [Kiritimatiellota bacterium]